MRRARMSLFCCLLVLMSVLVTGPAGSAGAAVSGLTNVGFETGDLSHWSVGPVVDAVEVVSSDGFLTAPFEGNFMARIGTPDFSGQPMGPNVLTQDFVVDQPEETFVYNIFTYDYQGYDEFRYEARVTDPDTGEVLASFQQGAYGSGTELKTTGWRGAVLDLSGHVGETVRLTISAGGTLDSLYNFWAYIDSGEAGLPAVVAPLIDSDLGSGAMNVDPTTGEVTITMPASNTTDIDFAAQVVCQDGSPADSASLLLFPASGGFSTVTPTSANPPADGLWTWTLGASSVVNGDLVIQAVCSGVPTQSLTVGSIMLYDPSGFVTDAVTGDPIVGVTVTLFSVPGWSAKTSPGDTAPNTCESNLSKAPGADWSQPAPAGGVQANPFSGLIDPQINPQATNSAGYYGWDVAAGCWYVVLTAPGYEPLTSPVVGVPPEVTDLDLEMTPLPVVPPGGVMCAGQVATIVGTAGADVITGTKGPDVISGLGGDDVITGSAGDDLICGDAGDDTLRGSGGHDMLRGGGGDDTLLGQAGNDLLIGAAGDDALNGGPHSGQPFDRCAGSSGVDSARNCESREGVP